MGWVEWLCRRSLPLVLAFSVGFPFFEAQPASAHDGNGVCGGVEHTEHPEENMSDQSGTTPIALALGGTSRSFDPFFGECPDGGGGGGGVPAPPPEALPSDSVTIEIVNLDPGYALAHDWGPAIVLEQGVANSCVTRDSEVAGRANLCRVVDGYEGIGDNRNWLIQFPVGRGPLGQSGTDSSAHGRIIVLDGGSVFEGCDFRSPDNSYLCDYRQRKAIVLKTSGDAYSYALRKLWDWSKYAGNTAGCATGISGVWAGAKIRLPLLSDCADGPL